MQDQRNISSKNRPNIVSMGINSPKFAAVNTTEQSAKYYFTHNFST
jgi:hypothetical protein